MASAPVLPWNLPEGAEARLSSLAKRVYRALHMSGFARMDVRMRADGSVFVLEANANPNLTYGEDFAESAHITPGSTTSGC